MRKIIILAFTGLSLSLTSTNTSSVYICDSTTAKKYHLAKNCRGLRACKSEVIQISLTKAKSLDRTLCGWED